MKRLVVKSSIKKFKADTVLLQETKIDSMEDRFVRDLWSGKCKKWISPDANGSSGGILMLWNSRSVEIKNWWADSFSLSAVLRDLHGILMLWNSRSVAIKNWWADLTPFLSQLCRWIYRSRRSGWLLLFMGPMTIGIMMSSGVN